MLKGYKLQEGACILNVTVEWLALLLCIWVIPCLIPDHEASIPDWGVLWLSSVATICYSTSSLFSFTPFSIHH
jgi:hypothetical protein